MIRIRLADERDAEAIARIHVAGWRAAYADLIPADHLADLDVSERTARWRTRLGAAADPGAPTFVAVDEAERLGGFVHTGPVRDDDLPPAGRAEVYTIYVDPSMWRQGIGGSLMAAVDDFWGPRHVHEMVLWAFEANQAARAFYERLGYVPDGSSQIDDFGGTLITEVRYRRSR